MLLVSEPSTKDHSAESPQHASPPAVKSLRQLTIKQKALIKSRPSVDAVAFLQSETLVKRMLAESMPKVIKEDLRLIKLALSEFNFKSTTELVKRLGEAVKTVPRLVQCFGDLCLDLDIKDSPYLPMPVNPSRPEQNSTKEVLRPRPGQTILSLRDQL